MCSLCRFVGLVVLGNKEARLGSAEIRVVYEGKTYAAPNMIYHYVVKHHYRPPDEFIQAVLKGSLPGSPEYESVKRDRGWL